MRKTSPKTVKKSIKNFLNIASVFMLAYTVSVMPAYSAGPIPPTLTTTGETLTTITNPVTSSYNVTTNTIKSGNAFNAFSQFIIPENNTVNMIVPNRAQNLVNIIRNGPGTVNGTLNSIRFGKIDGNVFFVDPAGFMVGANGIINVGSLTVVTPPASYLDTVLGAKNTPDLKNIINNAPVNAGSVVQIDGKINALTDVKIDSAVVKNTGEINTGAKFEYTDNVNFSDVVNVSDYDAFKSGVAMVSKKGEIVIEAVDTVENSGTLFAGRRTGDVNITASSKVVNKGVIYGDEVTLSASNNGNSYVYSTGGEITSLDSLTLSASSVTGKAKAYFQNATVNSGDDLLLESNSETGAVWSMILNSNITVDGSLDVIASLDSGSECWSFIKDSSNVLASNDINLNATSNSGVTGTFISSSVINSDGDLSLIGESNFGAGRAYITNGSTVDVSGGVSLYALSDAQTTHAYIQTSSVNAFDDINLVSGSNDGQAWAFIKDTNPLYVQTEGNINIEAFSENQIAGTFISNSFVSAYNDINLTSQSTGGSARAYITNNAFVENYGDITLNAHSIDDYSYSYIKYSTINTDGDVSLFSSSQSSNYAQSFIFDSTLNIGGDLLIDAYSQAGAAWAAIKNSNIFTGGYYYLEANTETGSTHKYKRNSIINGIVFN